MGFVVDQRSNWCTIRGMSDERVTGCLEEISTMSDLVAAVGHHERFGAQIAVAVAALNDAGAWADGQSLSMGGWLRTNTKLASREITALARTGKFLLRHDHVAEAALSGRLSAAQVAALRATPSRLTSHLFEQHLNGIITTIEQLDAQQTEVALAAWRANAEDELEIAPPTPPERSWTAGDLPDGSLMGRFVFDKTAAEILQAAIETARCFDGADDNRTPTMRTADAVIEIFSFFNSNNTKNATPRHHPHVELIVELADLVDGKIDDEVDEGADDDIGGQSEGDSETEGHVSADAAFDSAGDETDAFGEADSAEAAAETSTDAEAAADDVFVAMRRRPDDRGVGGSCAVTANGRMLPTWATDAFLCDCVLHKVLRDSAGRIIDYGRTTHTVPPRLWKAVAHRDRGCRVPGCNRPKAWTNAHHITWWRHHGSTKLDNLILLCVRHHHIVHRERWTIVLRSDGTATFTLPSGRVLISTPPGQPTIRAA